MKSGEDICASPECKNLQNNHAEDTDADKGRGFPCTMLY